MHTSTHVRTERINTQHNTHAHTLQVGEDGDGTDYKRYLGEGEGVDVTGVGLSREHATGKAFISVDANGGNQIIIYAGANGDFSPGEVTQKALR